MDRKYDVVIIGSGLGGLACGYILSKNGYKVAVLEKNRQFGGCLQNFVRKGAKFETGMHYIGSVSPGQTLNQFFKYLSLLDALTFSELDKNGFDIISIGGNRYVYASGYDNFAEKMIEKFPHDAADIRQYVAAIRKVADSSPMYSLSNLDQIALLSPEWVKTSVNDFVATVVRNPLLQDVLVGTLPLYAGVRDKTPAFIHALICNFYINGANRIVGGSDAIALSLVKSIRSFGGEAFSSAKSVKINCCNGKASSVVLENGTVVETDYIISNVHPENTLQMIDSPLIRQVYRDRISHLEQTVSNFTVYLRFKENTVPYLNANFYHYSGDVWGCEQYTGDDWPRNYLYMHMCPSASATYAGAGEIIAYMRYEDVARWTGTKVGNRGKDYEDFKQQHAEKLIDSLEEQFPGTKKGIDACYTSSPLTYIDYTGTKEGSMYGVIRDKNAPKSTVIAQRTKIPNLFFTGQNINSHGILGVIIGSILTCSEILGYQYLMKQVLRA
ncbi:MAG: NAD(P)/FAD-dependent oxidoreductase [Bacteroidales bacterium]|jgi:all-trans-retinol 13,14-reductase|nr:NAD(P)/FAD-dependent oxidoreductase [Bacteroidales bacterium]